jgi:hypothetical protein
MEDPIEEEFMGLQP